MVDFKIYDVTDYTINNYNTHFTQYLMKYRQPGNEIWFIKYSVRNTFVETSCRKLDRKPSSKFSLVFSKKLYVGLPYPVSRRLLLVDLDLDMQ